MMKLAIFIAFFLAFAPAMAQFKITQKSGDLGDKGVILDGKTKLRLHGKTIHVGDRFPIMRLQKTDGSTYLLGNKTTEKTLIVTLYSLGVADCRQNMKEYYNELKNVSFNVVFISADPSIIQKRFINENKMTNVTMLSDAKVHHFGLRTGTLIRRSYLLARSLIVVDENAVIRHIQRVPDLMTFPDLDMAMNKMLN